MNIFEKENLKILVTDSGIGGLSVASIIIEKLKNNRAYKNVEIAYCDARENKSFRYNEIADQSERVKIFSKRLYSLQEIFNPDIIFIACNTLSILYSKTEFFKQAKIPVIDIFSVGVQSMIEHLVEKEDNNVFILGTRTTITENSYKKELVSLGFDEERIINQMCPNLAKYIETSLSNENELGSNISWIVKRILEKKKENWKEFSISLNCTHYIYVIDTFLNEFRAAGHSPKFICPNVDMCKIFDLDIIKNRFFKSNVNFKICNNFNYNENGIKRLHSYYFRKKNVFYKHLL